MPGHLKNIEQLLCYTLGEISPPELINILYERLNRLIESQVQQRDIENFISYLKFVLSAPVIPKKLTLDVKLVQHFVNRTYAGFDTETKEFRVKKIYEYLKDKIGERVEINNKNLEQIEQTLHQETKPSFEKLKERVLIATMLKWLQGPLKDQLSMALRDYIIFLATSFGQYETQRILNIEKETYEVSKKDLTTIVEGYDTFELALMEAIQAIRSAGSTVTKDHSVREQFQVVFDSLDNLIKRSQEGKLEDMLAFKDKLIVSVVLIYLQDEFVEKDTEIKSLVQLFVALITSSVTIAIRLAPQPDRSPRSTIDKQHLIGIIEGIGF